MKFEQLYELSEEAKVQFTGFVSDHKRYDFAFIFTDHFFGKTLVICMQTGKSSLISFEDAGQIDFLQRVFAIREHEEAEELSLFLQQHLPAVPNLEQY
mgnify:CR=1 FL=1